VSRIYLSPPEVTGKDLAHMIAAVDSNWVAPVGPDLDAFEAEVAMRCGRAHGVGLTSGTAGLHLALRELGVATGDEVLVSSFTFAATANAVVYCGATPVLIDADQATWQISPELLKEAIHRRRKTGARLAAAIVVDLYGQCADYERIVPILEEAEIPLIEDAAEALGATYGGRAAGSFGRAGVVSFNGNKIITTSGGGMLITDDERLASRIRYLSTQSRSPAPHYEHEEIGFNYRLSNLLAAFGRGQLEYLDRRVERRRWLNREYRRSLADLPGLGFMPEASYGVSTCWLTCITIDPTCSRLDKEGLRQALEERDIESRPTWKPMHLQPVYRDAPAVIDGVSAGLFARGLCLPSGSGMSDTDLERVIQAVQESLAQ
jgi:pyridoxal phosphate-dependent aminotransferase EpsN